MAAGLEQLAQSGKLGGFLEGGVGLSKRGPEAQVKLGLQPRSNVSIYVEGRLAGGKPLAGAGFQLKF